MNSESNSPQETTTSFSMDDFAKALEEHDYEFKKGQVVKGKPFEYGSEGAYVDIGGKSPGFVPYREASLSFFDDLEEILPQEELEFLIIREQDAEGQVLISRRQLQMKVIWEELADIQEKGQSVSIKVTGTNKGGITGDVNGLRGFIPRSHLIEKQDLESLIGQNLTATFLELNPDTNKLVLSQREAARSQVISKLESGKLMEGTVVNLKPYGAFIDLGGVTGLLHIKEISHNSVDSLPALLQVGKKIKVMIKDIDEWKKRISLSTKILENHPGEILEKMDEVMATAEERAAGAREKLLEGKGDGEVGK